MTRERLARLRSLAAPGSGATDAERETVERMIRRAVAAERAYQREEARDCRFDAYA